MSIIFYSAFTKIYAQFTSAVRLDSLFNQLDKNQDFNGSILIAEKGKPVYQKSFGYADFENKVPNTIDSHFSLASISKTFTSTAILQLKEKGKLKIEDSFAKYFPEFPFPAITIKHLLSHTSGLPDLELYESIVNQNRDTIITNKVIIPTLKTWGRKLYFQPGDKWGYANINYALLGLLVEKVSKMSFETYLKKNIFLPANMTNTYLKPAFDSQNDKNRVVSHRMLTWYADTFKSVDSIKTGSIRYCTYNCGNTYGDNNIITTTEEMLKYDKALYEGKLLSQASLDEAFTPIKLNDGTTFYETHGGLTLFGKSSYGLGWEIYEHPTLGKAVGHSGRLFGLLTHFYRNITKNQTIIIYQNTELEGNQFYEKTKAALDILNGQQPKSALSKKSIARKYGNAIMKNGIDYATAIFNDLKTDTAHYYISENEFNWLGYDLLFQGKQKQYSLETFKLNTLLFPNSFNVYDSYAESLHANGKREEAIIMYQKSITMNPQNEGGIRMLKKILEK